MRNPWFRERLSRLSLMARSNHARVSPAALCGGDGAAECFRSGQEFVVFDDRSPLAPYFPSSTGSGKSFELTCWDFMMPSIFAMISG